MVGSDILVLMLRLLAVMPPDVEPSSLQAEPEVTQARTALLEIERRVSARLAELDALARR